MTLDAARTYINDESHAEIICPQCRNRTRVPLESLGSKHQCKVKCACSHIFMLEIEFRDKFRKQVDLPGFYEIAQRATGANEEGIDIRWGNVHIDRKTPNCQVIDLSRTGIGFLVNDGREVNPKDLILLKFTLDNTANTEIIQECEVRHVNNNFVGCRMLNENVNLGFYLID